MRHGAGVPFEAAADSEAARDAEQQMQGLRLAAGEDSEQPGSSGKAGTEPSTSAAGAAAAALPMQQQQQLSGPAAGSGSTAPQPEQQRLGCYFCNDVVAPLNSTLDRAMDQQCTVARPGLSALAGALAVELMAAVLQHPAGAGAPAAGSAASRAAAAAHELPLGEPPHMVRGQLAGFSQMCLTGQAFRQCTACSPAVVRQYRQRGADFVLQVGMVPAAMRPTGSGRG